jgi:cytochrome c
MLSRQLFPALAGLWMASVSGAALADAAAGEAVFRAKCTECHLLDGNKEGPALRGAHGRKAGSTSFEGYLGLRDAEFVWNDALLNEFLTDPKAFVKTHNRKRVVGKKFLLENPQERADVSEHL